MEGTTYAYAYYLISGVLSCSTYTVECGSILLRYSEIEREGKLMQLQEIDTLQDLMQWVEENMQGARVTQDSAGDIVIHTGLISTMGGYLHEREGDDE